MILPVCGAVASVARFLYMTRSSIRVLALSVSVACATATFQYVASVPVREPLHVSGWVILLRGFCKASWPTFVLLHSLRFVLESLGFADRTRFVADFSGYLRLVALVCMAALPRFLLFDALGGVPFALWYGVVLVVVDGASVHLLGAEAPARRWVWRVHAIVLVPWGVYAWVPDWPDPAWAVP